MFRRWRTRRQEAAWAAAGATGSQPGPEDAVPEPALPTRSRHGWRESGPVLVLRSAHPKQALLTAAGVAAAAALAGRELREVGLVFATVLVGQAMVGWHNDLVDRKRDRADERPRKPLAEGSLDPGTVWFTIACGALLVVPLAISSGLVAGAAYLIALAVGLLGNLLFRRGWLSWLTWAVSFGLYPAYLSYGGWGGEFRGDPPEISVTVLAALLGVCVHVLRALPGLVQDNSNGFRHVPLRLALKIGAPRLMYLAIVATALVVAGLVVTGAQVGLSQ